VKLFSYDDKDESYEIYEDYAWSIFIDSIAGFCLIRRYDMHDVFSKTNAADKIQFLIDNSYLPEMEGIEFDKNDIISFISHRDEKLQDICKEIWNY